MRIIKICVSTTNITLNLIQNNKYNIVLIFKNCWKLIFELIEQITEEIPIKTELVIINGVAFSFFIKRVMNAIFDTERSIDMIFFK